MKKQSLMLLLSVLSVSFAYSQKTSDFGGIVVGQIRTVEISANAVFGCFENDCAMGTGSVCSFGDSGNVSGIEKTEAENPIGFRIDGRTIRIDEENASNGVRICALDGRTVYAGKAATITLPAGVYLLSLKNETQKIIIH